MVSLTQQNAAPLPGMDDTDHALLPRFSAELVATALKDTPVVMVTGPRQCGKTTLVRDLEPSCSGMCARLPTWKNST
jgi:polynucleotide 5'-kinase involved in rRNA processing